MIDRARHGRLVHDLMFQLIASPRGRRRLLALAVVSLVIGRLGGSWLLGANLTAVAAVVQLLYWRIQMGRSMRRGLGVGQRVAVAYADSGELTVADVTGQIWLPRSSAFIVLRKGDIVTVLGRATSFVLPGELLTEADIAFLEGHGEAPEEPTTPGPPLPLALEVTPAVQSQIVEGATRVIATSADFLMPYVVAPLLLGFAALTRSLPFLAATTVFCLVKRAADVAPPCLDPKARPAHVSGRHDHPGRGHPRAPGSVHATPHPAGAVERPPRAPADIPDRAAAAQPPPTRDHAGSSAGTVHEAARTDLTTAVPRRF